MAAPPVPGCSTAPGCPVVAGCTGRAAGRGAGCGRGAGATGGPSLKQILTSPPVNFGLEDVIRWS